MECFEHTRAGLVSNRTFNVTGVSAVRVSSEWDNEGRPVAQKFPDLLTGCRRLGKSCEPRPREKVNRCG